MNNGNDTTNHMVVEGSDSRPYALLGAGRVTSAIWKEGDERSGWEYGFNIFWMDKVTGVVGQRFQPQDIPDLSKLVRLLAFEIANDGCLEGELRDDLFCLATCLDEVFPSINSDSFQSGSTPDRRS